MLHKIGFWGIVVLIPLAFCIYLALSGTVLVLVDNRGADITVSARIASGRNIEQSEPREISGFRHISFSPQLSGRGYLVCQGADGGASLKLGDVVSGDFTVLLVSAQGCGRMSVTRRLTL